MTKPLRFIKGFVIKKKERNNKGPRSDSPPQDPKRTAVTNSPVFENLKTTT